MIDAYYKVDDTGIRISQHTNTLKKFMRSSHNRVVIYETVMPKQSVIQSLLKSNKDIIYVRGSKYPAYIITKRGATNLLKPRKRKTVRRKRGGGLFGFGDTRSTGLPGPISDITTGLTDTLSTVLAEKSGSYLPTRGMWNIQPAL